MWKFWRRKVRLVLFECPICGRKVYDWPERATGIRKYCVCGTYMQEHLR